MVIPPRPQRGACTRTPRLLSAVTIGAVTLGATLGLVPGASAEPLDERTLFVDIVGDSYMAGDGTESYLDPADPRHRSLVSPALQALSRVAGENPGLRVDANVVASSGAVTADYFAPQQAAEAVVNTAQHDQIRPNAQVVVVGFGGSDAELASVLAIAKPSNSSTPGDLAAKVKGFGGLLDTSAPDQAYLDQASAAPLGTAPTLVSRLLQVLGGIAARAPHAHIIVTNYPVSVDPANPHSTALIKEHDLVTVQKFVLDLNATIERAVEICACASLVDLTEALDGHEAYTEESAYAEPTADEPHPTSLEPNDQGAALMADPLAKNLATALGIRPPQPTRGKVTVPDNIAARNGESDVDGDLVPDHDDESPGDRTNHRKKHGGAPLVVIDLGNRDRHHDRNGHDGRDHRGDRRSRPEGRLPVQILPPAAPHRESGPASRPENRKAAEPDAGERKPAVPKRSSEQRREEPSAEQFRVTEWTLWLSNHRPDDTDSTDVTPKAPVDDETPEVAPKTPADDESPDGFGSRAPAEDEAQAPEVAPKAPADGESAGGFGWEAPADDESIGGLGEAPEVAPKAPAEEPAAGLEPVVEEAPPTGDVGSPDGLQEAPPVESAWRVVPEPEPEPEPDNSWRAPATDESPVMPVTEVPRVWRPETPPVAPKEQADGEPVCILIYPAPEGCGS